MGGIKYYQLAKGEELPYEFCAVRDVDGEPGEYTFYVPETENDKLREDNDRLIQAIENLHDVSLEDKLVQLENENARLQNDADLLREMLQAKRQETHALMAENAKLRELIADVHEALCADKAGMFHKLTLASMEDDMRELGIEVD